MQPLSSYLELIKDKPEFRHTTKDNYSYIDYSFETDETFDNKELCELRGLIFDTSGNLIRRPLHKFFNYGTKHAPIIKNINDWLILEKLDGSMLAPFTVDSTHYLGTRAGITDVSDKATEFAKSKENYFNFIGDMYKVGLTPIFEYISPNNQIVIKYSESNLILTAIRSIVDGKYCSYETLRMLSSEYNIPLVKAYHFDDFESLMSQVTNMEDEGFVLVHKNGQDRVKLKSPYYCQLHKSKDGIRQEKDLIKLIIDNKIDDLVPFLDETDKKYVLDYQSRFNKGIDAYIKAAIYAECRIVDLLPIINKAEFSKVVKYQERFADWVLYAAFENKLNRDFVISKIERKLGSQKGVDAMRFLWETYV